MGTGAIPRSLRAGTAGLLVAIQPPDPTRQPVTSHDILDLRTRSLPDRRIVKRDYVPCWIQQALRAEEDPVLGAAIPLGN